jgi:hypothetical protein
MSRAQWALRLIEQEARALLTRLALVKPFALNNTMVIAASVPIPAQVAIESFLASGRRQLARMVHRFIRWLRAGGAFQLPVSEVQRRFTFLRLRFNAVLTQFDIFAAVMTQRSQSEIGVWLSGLDVASADAIQLPGNHYTPPPIVCYLDRGHGAAIRRARTRLPGGGRNPVAVVRIPRERMVGSGIASSLVHEVGHQASALLDLVNSFRPVLRGFQTTSNPERLAWQLWERWISEIVADFWSVAKLGIGATLGLLGVVSLPRVFVMRVDTDDPHPTPWVRVKLSCAMGQMLYPDPQWDAAGQIWESFYPLDGLAQQQRRIFELLQDTMPAFVNLLVTHRPRMLRGKSLREALQVEDRQPVHLRELFQRWRDSKAAMYEASPSVVFAVVGQARADGRITPEEESATIGRLLTHWALRSSLDASAICAASAARQFADAAREAKFLN